MTSLKLVVDTNILISAALSSQGSPAKLVQKVLADIGAADIPRILVYNKIDAAGLEPRVEQDAHGTICRVFVSAQQRLGLDGLRHAITQFASIPENNAISIEDIQSE